MPGHGDEGKGAGGGSVETDNDQQATQVSAWFRIRVAQRLNPDSRETATYRKYRGVRTPPWPTFRARLLHNKEGVGLEKGGIGKIPSIDSCPETCRLVLVASSFPGYR